MRAPLEIHDLCRHFGAIKAVDEVSLTVEPGSRHGLIGPNGAGKSTLFSLIAGAQPPSSGTITFEGEDITAMSMPARARLGIQQSFQHSKLFLAQTTVENVCLAVRRVQGSSLRFWRPAGRDTAVRERAMECLQMVGLADRADVQVSSLSHGERRQLEVAVLLAGDPQLILLDEPTAGMSQAETNRFVELITSLPQDYTLIIVEHDLEVVFSIASTVSALDLGRLVVTGTPDEVRSDERVQRSYLGAGAESDVFDPPVKEIS